MGIHLPDWVENLLRAISPFPTMFSKAVLFPSQNEYPWSKGLTVYKTSISRLVQIEGTYI